MTDSRQWTDFYCMTIHNHQYPYGRNETLKAHLMAHQLCNDWQSTVNGFSLCDNLHPPVFPSTRFGDLRRLFRRNDTCWLSLSAICDSAIWHKFASAKWDSAKWDSAKWTLPVRTQLLKAQLQKSIYPMERLVGVDCHTKKIHPLWTVSHCISGVPSGGPSSYAMIDSWQWMDFNCVTIHTH